MVLHLCFRLAMETQDNATLVFEQSVVTQEVHPESEKRHSKMLPLPSPK